MLARAETRRSEPQCFNNPSISFFRFSQSQIADINLIYTNVPQCTNRFGRDLLGLQAFGKVPRDSFSRNRKEAPQPLQCLGIRAVVMEYAEDTGIRHASAPSLAH